MQIINTRAGASEAEAPVPRFEAACEDAARPSRRNLGFGFGKWHRFCEGGEWTESNNDAHSPRPPGRSQRRSERTGEGNRLHFNMAFPPLRHLNACLFTLSRES